MSTPYPYPVPNPPPTDSTMVQGFPVSSSMTVTDILTTINDLNGDRSFKGQVWSFWIYFATIIGLVCYTLIPIVLTVYVFPGCFQKKPPQPQTDAGGAHNIITTQVIDLRKWFFWTFWIFMGVQFIISGAGGLPGWTVVNFVYLVYVLILWIVVCVRVREPEKPVSSGDPSAVAPPADPVAIPAGWTVLPTPMSRSQKIQLILLAVIVVTMFIINIILAYSYTPDGYLVMSRSTGYPAVEFVPQLTGNALQLMYSWPNFASDMRLSFYVKLFTTYCGNEFTKNLASGDKSFAINNQWIQQYSINMSWFYPSDYTQYSSVNQWFIRAIRPELRPIDSNPDSIVSPADCRLGAFQSVSDAQVWVKTGNFDYQTLLGGGQTALSGAFAGGQMVIARLAPQDYHRFHAPVSGTVLDIETISNTYWSVSADAARSQNSAFYNTRSVMIVDAGTRIGKVGIVAVGATCVGSVKYEYANNQTIAVGNTITKGQQIGFFQFGGSTVILLFQQGMVTLDADLVRNSAFHVETLINVGQRIGIDTLAAQGH